MVPQLILGVPVNPVALPVTAPVRGPTNPAAVQTPAAPTEYATPT